MDSDERISSEALYKLLTNMKAFSLKGKKLENLLYGLNLDLVMDLLKNKQFQMDDVRQ